MTPSALPCWRFAGIRFDERSLEVSIGEELLEVERKPLEVLRHLLRHAGEVVTKAELEEAVWPGRILSDTVLKKCIGRLREALRDSDEAIIKTVRGYGYRLVAEVSVELPKTPTPVPAVFELKPGDQPPLRPQWRLKAHLGSGGRGQAWLAAHEKTGEHRVYKFAVDEAALVALKREITLYRLLCETLDEHPAFVTILDWNLEQPPYFTESQWIAGGNLAEWAQRNQPLAAMPMAERLELAAQIADALAAAHSVGVLHKDLKPANVLVEIDGAAPKIRLADFGSGSVLDPDRLDRLGITRLGFTRAQDSNSETSGTLLYMAPEVLAGQPATVKADLYALGIMLYQLAVGDFSRSLATGWEADIDDEVLREDIAEAAQGNPERRLGDAAALALRLRTVEQRRARRRKQQAERVAAERAGRALERMRARRSGFIAAIVMLVLGLGASLWLYFDARAARLEAEAEKQLADQSAANSERAAAEADAASEFLTTDVFAGIGPGKDFRMQDLLDTIDRKIDKRFAHQPLLAAKVRVRLSSTYELLGDLNGAHRLDQELWAQVRQAVDQQSDDALALGLRWAEEGGGRVFETGLPYWHKLLALAQAKFGPGAPETLVIQQRLGTNEFEIGNYAGALREQQAAVAALRKIDPNAAALVIPLNRLAITQNALGDFAGAEATAREALALAVQTRGADSSITFFPRSLIAELKTTTGRYAEADDLLGALMPEMRRVRDERNTLMITTTIRLAQLRQMQDRRHEAETLLESARDRLQAGFGADDLDATARYAGPLASLYLAEQRLDEAETLIRHVDEIYRAYYPSEHPDVSVLKLMLAEVQLGKRRVVDARKTLDSIPSTRRTFLESVPLDRSRLLRIEGLVAFAEGRSEPARRQLAEAMKISQELFGENHPLTLQVSAELARVAPEHPV